MRECTRLLTPPFRLTVRQPSTTRRGEAYIVDGESFVAGMSSKASSHYEAIVKDLKELLSSGVFTHKHEANDFLKFAAADYEGEYNEKVRDGARDLAMTIE